MNYYAALDVSLRSVHLCVMDENGEIQAEGQVDSEPQDIDAFLRKLGLEITRVGLEAGTLTQYLTYGLRDAGPPQDGRASLWHNQIMDGIDTLPDQITRSGEYRDEFARAGVQHEANDEHPWHQAPDRGDKGIESPFSLIKPGKEGQPHLLLSATKIFRPYRSD